MYKKLVFILLQNKEYFHIINKKYITLFGKSIV